MTSQRSTTALVLALILVLVAAAVGIAVVVAGSGGSSPAEMEAPHAGRTETGSTDSRGARGYVDDDRWPGPHSTGVPDDVVLRRSGPIVISTPGAVVSGLDVRGDIVVLADGVVIREVRVIGGIIRVGDARQAVRDVVIADVEIDGTGRADAARLAGVGYAGFTLLRANIHNVGVGVAASADVVVRDSWIHDLVIEGHPANGGSHNEPILSNGGRNLAFIGNRLEAGTEPNMSAALALYGDFAPIVDVEVRGNLLMGGGYALYAGSVPEKAYPRAERVRVIDNVFVRGSGLQGGTFGPVTGWRDGPGHVWRGNTWSDDSSQVKPGA